MPAPSRLLLAASLLLLPAIGEAWAQGMIRPAQRPGAGGAPAPAPALPGLTARPAPPPISAGEAAANLSPNGALFDAVARGDLPAARDAVSRGADLEARNELGLTALDAAVDQGRNDIAFYLLSAREMTRGAPLPPEAGGGGLDSPPRPNARTPARRDAALRDAVPPANARTPQAALPRTARLWAGDGGAPQPDLGFLGFDAGRPAGATAPAARRAGRG